MYSALQDSTLCLVCQDWRICKANHMDIAIFLIQVIIMHRCYLTSSAVLAYSYVHVWYSHTPFCHIKPKNSLLVIKHRSHRITMSSSTWVQGICTWSTQKLTNLPRNETGRVNIVSWKTFHPGKDYACSDASKLVHSNELGTLFFTTLHRVPCSCEDRSNGRQCGRSHCRRNSCMKSSKNQAHNSRATL